MCLFLIYEMILLTFLIGNSFIFTLFTWADCTDEISIFRCDSDKNSLAIIYICFKMHFLKYVGIIILFYSILFMWTRCGYQMFLCAPPPCPSDHSNLLYSSAAPPPSSHQVQKRYQRYREERPMCIWSDWSFLAVPPPSNQVFS